MPKHGLKACPRCDTPLTGEEIGCPNCKRPLATPASASGLASVPEKKAVCPVCKLTLYPATFAEQPALHCAECKGLGLKREALMKIQPFGPKQLVPGPEERDYKRPPFFEPRQKPPFLICPFCSKKMKADKLGGAALDLCEACQALWMEAPRLEHFNEIIGPYKWKMSKAK